MREEASRQRSAGICGTDELLEMEGMMDDDRVDDDEVDQIHVQDVKVWLVSEEFNHQQ